MAGNGLELFDGLGSVLGLIGLEALFDVGESVLEGPIEELSQLSGGGDVSDLSSARGTDSPIKSSQG